MNILITGANGFIGLNLAKRLNENGLNVIGVSRSKIDEKIDIFNKYYQIDIFEEEILYEIMKKEKIDVVIHLAAKKNLNESFEKSDDYWETNYYGTARVLDAMLKAKIENIIFASTSAVYDEDKNLNPKSPYGKTKLASEKLISESSKLFNFNYLNVRFFNITGQGYYLDKFKNNGNILSSLTNYKNKDTKEIFEVFSNSKLKKDGTSEKDYIHIFDLCNILLELTHKIKKENLRDTIDIGSGKTFSTLEIVETFNQINKPKVNYILKEVEKLSFKSICSEKNSLIDYQIQFKELKDLLK